jgi:PKD repeat protein
MKTIWKLLLVAILFAGQNRLNAQCVFYSTSNTLLTAQFNAYLWDSSSIVGSTYFWEFGDGDTAQSLETSHTYAYSGTYSACFHYTSATCNYDSCFNVTVDSCNFNPVLTYSQNNTGVSFGIINAPAGVNYFWLLQSTNGGGSDTSSSPNPFFALSSSGGYSITAVVYTTAGCVDSISAYIYFNSPCTVNIQAYPTTAGGTEIQFYGAPFDSSGTNTYSYLWAFGDGSTSTSANPVHDYGTYGNYIACVNVVGAGCSDTSCRTISVTPPLYQISGYLNYSGSGNCSSKTLLITDTAGYLSLLSEDNTFIDSACLGYFSFYVPAGTYYLKGVLNSSDPNYANYLPTYYGDELLWANATPVVVTNSSITNLNINMVAGINPGGPGFVGGWVTQGAGLAIGGNHEERGIGDPLPNIQINIVNANGQAVAYTYTDANGRYTFSNLALGTYSIYAEEINKVPSPMQVTLTANNPSQDNVDVSINSNSAVTGINDLFDLQVEGLFPNPVTDKATLTVSLKQNSSAQLRVMDTKGSILTNEPIKLNAGANKIDINLSGKPAGIYLISLHGEAGSKIIRVAKAN